MLKAYAIGFFGAVLAIAVAAIVWLALQPRQEAGLLWGGTVYTSKQEFNGYLKSKGLSYRTWLARNPGAAPWEPATVRATRATTAVKAHRAAASAPKQRAVERWAERLPPVAIGLFAAAGALLLFLWRLRALLAGVPARAATLVNTRSRQNGGRTGKPSTLAASRRLGDIASGAARRLETSLPHYSQRCLDGARADARLLRAFMRERNISVGDVAFGLLAVVTAGVFGMFVVLLLSA